MLIIRNDQMEVFRQLTLRKFEASMVTHLSVFAPVQFKLLGEELIRQIIHLGIKRAKSYSLSKWGPVRLYLELMFMLGSDFDIDSQFPWANKILTEGDQWDQLDRAGRLYEEITYFVEAVAG